MCHTYHPTHHVYEGRGRYRRLFVCLLRLVCKVIPTSIANSPGLGQTTESSLLRSSCATPVVIIAFKAAPICIICKDSCANTDWVDSGNWNVASGHLLLWREEKKIAMKTLIEIQCQRQRIVRKIRIGRMRSSLALRICLLGGVAYENLESQESSSFL